jgi:hypothetical protein
MVRASRIWRVFEATCLGQSRIEADVNFLGTVTRAGENNTYAHFIKSWVEGAFGISDSQFEIHNYRSPPEIFNTNPLPHIIHHPSPRPALF